MFDTLNAREVMAGLATNEIALIDVRESKKFLRHHISGAVSIPIQEIPDRLGEIPTNKRVVFCCDDGKMAGATVTFLAGFARLVNVFSLNGGIENWVQAEHAA